MSEYVSLASLPEEIVMGGDKSKQAPAPLIWDMPLPPHIDTEKIVVNSRYLRTINRIGGVAGGVVTSYEGDVSESVPSVIGINADGSAVAGKTAAKKKAEMSKGLVYDTDNFVDEQIGHAVLLHRLNRAELASQVTDDVREGNSSEKAWAKKLDVALRHSYREGTYQHLTQRSSTFRRFMVYTIIPNTSLYVIEAPNSATAHFMAGSYALLQLINLSQQYNVKRKTGQRPPVRWSIFPYATQMDRFAMLAIASQRPGLIKSLK